MNNVIADAIKQSGSIEEYLQEQQNKSLLRFLTCGSVDDGKSTLIGRLLHDSRQVYEDQLKTLHADSQKVGTRGEKLDFALLVDGLQAEREQGITIDVAYRYFSTSKRKFIIADTPGHEQYTRNMATGASTCDLAIILIDARKGVLEQTRRHSFIASLLGIRQFIVAINKMDLVNFDEATFRRIEADYLAFAARLPATDIKVVPLSAVDGDNLVTLSERSPWYQGEPLLSLLENAEVGGHQDDLPARLPVQLVSRPDLNFRGYMGTLAAGTLRPGDTLRVLPSGRESVVERIVTFDGDLPAARAGQAITVTLRDEIDISRGDLLVAPQSPTKVGKRLLAHLVWMTDAALQTDRLYDIKLATRKTQGQFEAIRHRIDVNTLAQQPASSLQLNEIGLVELALTTATGVDPYTEVRDTGSFIVIDRLTNVTIGAGMVVEVLDDEQKAGDHPFSAFELEFNALVRKHFPHWQALDISKL